MQLLSFDKIYTAKALNHEVPTARVRRIYYQTSY